MMLGYCLDVGQAKPAARDGAALRPVKAMEELGGSSAGMPMRVSSTENTAVTSSRRPGSRSPAPPARGELERIVHQVCRPAR